MSRSHDARLPLVFALLAVDVRDGHARGERSFRCMQRLRANSLFFRRSIWSEAATAALEMDGSCRLRRPRGCVAQGKFLPWVWPTHWSAQYRASNNTCAACPE